MCGQDGLAPGGVRLDSRRPEELVLLLGGRKRGGVGVRRGDAHLRRRCCCEAHLGFFFERGDELAKSSRLLASKEAERRRTGRVGERERERESVPVSFFLLFVFAQRERSKFALFPSLSFFLFFSTLTFVLFLFEREKRRAKTNDAILLLSVFSERTTRRRRSGEKENRSFNRRTLSSPF